MADTLQIDPNWMQRVLEADKRLQAAKQAPGPFNLLPIPAGDVTRGEPSSAWDVLKQSVMSAFPAAGAAFGGPVGAALGLAMLGDTLYKEAHPTKPMIDPSTGQPVQVLMGEVPAGAKSLTKGATLRPSEEFFPAFDRAVDEMNASLRWGRPLQSPTELPKPVYSQQEEAPTYYSALKEAFSNPKMPNKLTPEQAVAIVEKTPGVKAEEGKWVFGEPRKFFQSKPRWTKQEILDHINTNAVDVVEVPSRVDPRTASAAVTPPFNPKHFNLWKDRTFDPEYVWRVRMPNGQINEVTGSYDYAADNYAPRFGGTLIDRPGAPFQTYYRTRHEGGLYELKDLQERYDQEFRQPQVLNDPGLFDPRWGPSGEYSSPLTLPNPQNYRERLLVWGNKPSTKEIPDFQKFMGENQLYRTQNPQTHDWDYFDIATDRPISMLDVQGLWDEYNRIVGAITNDFQTSHFPNQENILAHLRTTDRVTPDGKKVLFIEELQSDWQKQLRMLDKSRQDPRNTWDFQVSKTLHDKGLGEYAPLKKEDFDLLSGSGNLESRQELLRSTRGEYAPKVPEAPLARNYPELVMKRVLRLAADEGYDAVGWTTGKQQADRYNTTLLQGVSKLDYDLASNNLTIHTPNGGTQSMAVSPSQLPTYIGKEAAEKLINKVTAPPPVEKKIVFPDYEPKGNIDKYIDYYINSEPRSGSNFHIAVRLSQLRAVRRAAGRDPIYDSFQKLDSDLITLKNGGYTQYEIDKFKRSLGYQMPKEPTPSPVSLDVSDLQVGERGYSDLYDTSLGKIVDKLGKPLGAKSGEGKITIQPTKKMDLSADDPFFEWVVDTKGYKNIADIPIRELNRLREEYISKGGGTSTNVHLFPLTPALKSHAQTRGFPLFQVAPVGVGLGAASAAKLFEDDRKKPKSPSLPSY